MTGDDKGLPATLPGVFGMAATLFMRRFTLYAALTVIALGLQAVLDLTLLPDTGFAIGLDIILCAFIATAVSIGVAYDLAGKDADWSRIITAASMRWGVVALISFLAFFVNNLFAGFLTLSPDQTAFGLIFLPFIVLWGGVWMGTVVGAIEPAQSRLMLPLVALGKGLGVSTQFVNLGRLMVFSMLMLIVLEAEVVLNNRLDASHIADSFFWAQVPLDTLTTGPLQALATVFYVDFLRRAGR